MTAMTMKPLTSNQQAVYDYFSPGCSFTRADLIKLTRMQGNALTFPLMSLIKRGLIIETPGESVRDDVTYTMAATTETESSTMLAGQEMSDEDIAATLEGPASVTSSEMGTYYRPDLSPTESLIDTIARDMGDERTWIADQARARVCGLSPEEQRAVYAKVRENVGIISSDTETMVALDVLTMNKARIEKQAADHDCTIAQLPAVLKAEREKRKARANGKQTIAAASLITGEGRVTKSGKVYHANIKGGIRAQVITILQNGPRTLDEIAAQVEGNVKTTLGHLAYLGVVAKEGTGTTRTYRLI